MKKDFSIKIRRMTAIVLVLTMLIQLTACGGADSSSGLADEPGYGKWVDSDLKGSVSTDDVIRLQDDFAASANKETITSARVKDQLIWTTAADATDLLQTRFRELWVKVVLPFWMGLSLGHLYFSV